MSQTRKARPTIRQEWPAPKEEGAATARGGTAPSEEGGDLNKRTCNGRDELQLQTRMARSSGGKKGTE